MFPQTKNGETRDTKREKKKEQENILRACATTILAEAPETKIHSIWCSTTHRCAYYWDWAEMNFDKKFALVRLLNLDIWFSFTTLVPLAYLVRADAKLARTHRANVNIKTPSVSHKNICAWRCAATSDRCESIDKMSIICMVSWTKYLATYHLLPYTECENERTTMSIQVITEYISLSPHLLFVYSLTLNVRIKDSEFHWVPFSPALFIHFSRARSFSWPSFKNPLAWL